MKGALPRAGASFFPEVENGMLPERPSPLRAVLPMRLSLSASDTRDSAAVKVLEQKLARLEQERRTVLAAIEEIKREQRNTAFFAG